MSPLSFVGEVGEVGDVGCELNRLLLARIEAMDVVDANLPANSLVNKPCLAISRNELGERRSLTMSLVLPK